MKVVSVISQKGGAGKTTLAVHLAVAAEAAGQTAVLVDLDPQASASEWKDARTADTPAVVSAQAVRLDKVLAAAKAGGADWVFIDTAPHSQNDALAAARAADLILIPCRPSGFDLRAVKSSVALAQLANKPAIAVLNGVQAKGVLGEEAEEAITTVFRIPVSPCRIGYRISYVHATTGGQTVLESDPKGKAAEEVRALYRWLEETLQATAS